MLLTFKSQNSTQNFRILFFFIGLLLYFYLAFSTLLESLIEHRCLFWQKVWPFIFRAISGKLLIIVHVNDQFSAFLWSIEFLDDSDMCRLQWSHHPLSWCNWKWYQFFSSFPLLVQKSQTNINFVLEIADSQHNILCFIEIFRPDLKQFLLFIYSRIYFRHIKSGLNRLDYGREMFLVQWVVALAWLWEEVESGTASDALTSFPTCVKEVSHCGLWRFINIFYTVSESILFDLSLGMKYLLWLLNGPS